MLPLAPPADDLFGRRVRRRSRSSLSSAIFFLVSSLSGVYVTIRHSGIPSTDKDTEAILGSPTAR